MSLDPSHTNSIVIEPFLHVSQDALYNPLRDVTLETHDTLFQPVNAIIRGERSLHQLDTSLADQLLTDGWLVVDDNKLGERFRLKYVQIESNTICNHSCSFCPVSVSPRKNYRMPLEVFDQIMRQLARYSDTLEGVWLHHYNEPTTDGRLVDLIKLVRSQGLSPCMNSNASGLTPKKVRELIDAGGLQSLTINLSTLDREKYKRQRGIDQLPLVQANLAALKHTRLAEHMHIVVIGDGDPEEQLEFERISEFFKGSEFQVYHYAHNNRASRIETGISKNNPSGPLGGCDFKGSRPLQHLTIDAYANVVLCCQDYYSDYKAGNLSEQTLDLILTGERMAQLRRWTYGRDVAPDSFICRTCAFVQQPAPSVSAWLTRRPLSIPVLGQQTEIEQTSHLKA